MRLVRTAARPRTSAAWVAAAVAAFSLVGPGAAAAPAEPASVLGANLAVNSADACVDSDEIDTEVRAKGSFDLLPLVQT